jgi:2-polyprenyl-6-methoxyphenol hydroxylase-like FAD-dependent oxidoreductase
MATYKNTEHQTEVVIIGGGPVGAALSGDLGRRGIPNILLEMTDGVFRDPRLHAVNIRTMELARRWQIEDDLRNCGWPADHSQDILFVTALTGYELGRIEWPAIGTMSPPDASPTFAQRCPQAWFNPILVSFARRQAVSDVRMRWRCDSFVQDEAGVTVHATDLSDESRHIIRAKYLVAADGSRSNVRRALGIHRNGPDAYGLSAEAIVEIPHLSRSHSMGLAGRYTLVTEQGMSASLLPFDGRNLYRMTTMVEQEGMTEATMAEAVRALIGANVPFEFKSPVLPWSNRETCAQSFLSGRVFIAGDAAHTMPTTGGFGMNTGILDSWDLGWKLEADIKGWGGPLLCGSYDHERKLAAQRTARLAGAIYKDWLQVKNELDAGRGLLLAENADGYAYRAHLGDTLVRTFRREFNAVGGALGYRYEGSPICIADGTSEPDDSLTDYRQTSRPGHRAPHVWLEDGRSTLDLFGEGFVLMTRDARSAVAQAFKEHAASVGVPFTVFSLNSPALQTAYEVDHVLVRPDGHVAWRSVGAAPAPAAVLDIARGVPVVH